LDVPHFSGFDFQYSNFDTRQLSKQFYESN